MTGARLHQRAVIAYSQRHDAEVAAGRWAELLGALET